MCRLELIRRDLPVLMLAGILGWFAPATGQVTDSLHVYLDVVAQNPKDGPAWIRLGHVYLDADSLDQAENAFRKAQRSGEKARGHNGLGLVYGKRGRSWYRKAFTEFRKAAGADKTFAEAMVNAGRLHARAKEEDAEDAFRRAMRMDPGYAPAYIALAEWFLSRGYAEHEKDLTELFEEYLKMRPDDSDGHYGLALTLTANARFDQVRPMAEEKSENYPDESRWLPLVAQSKAATGDLEGALDAWRVYLWMQPEEESALYTDLARVARPSELASLTTGKSADRFWEASDPTMYAGGAAARVEHYRRVWHAINHYGRGQKPWDKRGDVYIRYGEPDYRSTSRSENGFPSGAAALVKERLFNELAFAADPENAFTRPGYQNAESGPGLSDGIEGETIPDMSGVGAAPIVGPVYPMEVPKPWESWIYTQVGGGVEFLFLDHGLNGEYGFPFPPVAGPDTPIEVITALMNADPGVRFAALSSEQPNHYSVPYGMVPLSFYYDFASFRAPNGRTRLEIYYMVPPDQVSVEPMGDREVIAIDRAVTLRRSAADSVDIAPVTTRQSARYGNKAGAFKSGGSFIVDQAALEVDPGDYRLAVQLVDATSGKWGIYVQDVEVPAYGADLTMSNLQMAYTVSQQPLDAKYRKRDPSGNGGDVWVIPMPSRSFVKGQKVHTYYEVYNLAQNEFGQTSYEVTYTIEQDIQSGAGIYGAISGLFRKLMANRSPEIEISYSATGGSGSESIYLEIDTAQMKTGYNRMIVMVRDLVAGATVERREILRLEGVDDRVGDRGGEGGRQRERRGRR